MKNIMLASGQLELNNDLLGHLDQLDQIAFCSGVQIVVDKSGPHGSGQMASGPGHRFDTQQFGGQTVDLQIGFGQGNLQRQRKAAVHQEAGVTGGQFHKNPSQADIDQGGFNLFVWRRNGRKENKNPILRGYYFLLTSAAI
jgi:hypothetical protein